MPVRTLRRNREGRPPAMQVYHTSRFGLIDPQWPEDYAGVAEVVCTSIEDAYRLTNSIDRAWWENPEVEMLETSPLIQTAPDGTKGFRSTSVGDVVVDLDGEVHRCDDFGWTNLGEEEEATP